MAELKNESGVRIRFDPKSVTAVTDHDDLGNPGTFVYGLMKPCQQIAETIDGFLSRTAIKPNFVKLTRLPGTAFWINVDAIDYLRPALAADTPGAGAAVGMGDARIEIKEGYDAAVAVIKTIRAQF